jgi:type II secretory pathway pseudopilin PulG
MASIEPQPAAPSPRPPFQFTLRTLLLPFVVLGSSLAVFGVGGIVVFILVLLLATDCRRAISPVSLLRLLVALLCLGCLGVLLMSGFEGDTREAGRDAQCRNNLKQIVLALLIYEEAKGGFPPAYTLDNSGKPMHSWRVRILPYSDMDDVYKKYAFGEPWNGPSNKSISNTIVPLYLCSSDRKSSGTAWTRTNYLAVVGPHAAWASDKFRELADFGNQAAHTIMVVEVTDSGVQ